MEIPSGEASLGQVPTGIPETSECDQLTHQNQGRGLEPGEARIHCPRCRSSETLAGLEPAFWTGWGSEGPSRFLSCPGHLTEPKTPKFRPRSVRQPQVPETDGLAERPPSTRRPPRPVQAEPWGDPAASWGRPGWGQEGQAPAPPPTWRAQDSPDFAPNEGQILRFAECRDPRAR